MPEYETRVSGRKVTDSCSPVAWVFVTAYFLFMAAWLTAASQAAGGSSVICIRTSPAIVIVTPLGDLSIGELTFSATNFDAFGAVAVVAAGGDGTQALVATIAAEHDLPFACIPAGTRNHFALDLGVDRDDVVGALDAFVAGGRERRVDLAEVNGRVFVNNVSMGVYASAVQSDGYRDAKVSTLLDTVSDVVGPDADGGAAMRWLGPDGSDRGSAAVLMVSNNPYRLGALFGNGTRQRLDGGVLGVAATRERGESRLSSSWTCAEFVVESDQPIPLGVDGEALVMDSPVEFRSRPGALRVRVAPQHPGGSPSSGAPNGLGDALHRLVALISDS